MTVALNGETARLKAAELELVPVPLRDAVWGLPDALSETLTKALSLKAVDGLKVRLMMQLAPAASVAGEIGQLLV